MNSSKGKVKGQGKSATGHQHSQTFLGMGAEGTGEVQSIALKCVSDRMVAGRCTDVILR